MRDSYIIFSPGSQAHENNKMDVALFKEITKATKTKVYLHKTQIAINLNPFLRTCRKKSPIHQNPESERY